jgi:hypothetical protein
VQKLDWHRTQQLVVELWMLMMGGKIVKIKNKEILKKTSHHHGGISTFLLFVLTFACAKIDVSAMRNDSNQCP